MVIASAMLTLYGEEKTFLPANSLASDKYDSAAKPFMSCAIWSLSASVTRVGVGSSLLAAPVSALSACAGVELPQPKSAPLRVIARSERHFAFRMTVSLGKNKRPIRHGSGLTRGRPARQE